MTRNLVTAPPGDFFAALRDALGHGDALFAGGGEAGATMDTLPATVGQRIALVVQSSGSTGNPKRVALSADALLASAAASESALGGPGQWLLALPTSYIAGINVLVRSIAAETIPVELPAGHFDTARFTEAAGRMDAALRFTSLVPAQLGRLLDDPAAIPALRRFDRILVGGQSTPAPLLERATDLGIHITRTYGSSETSGGCVYDGVPIGTTAVRASGGQLEIAGPVLADGYLADPARTEQAFVVDDGQRWYRTGDAGSVIDGVVTVTGRLDDVIISGGVKVSLGEVESVVRGLPGLADAVVVRTVDDHWGEVPVVVTVASPQLDDVRSAVVARLGRAAAPARIVTLPRIPTLSTGKPDRLSIRAAVES